MYVGVGIFIEVINVNLLVNWLIENMEILLEFLLV